MHKNLNVKTAVAQQIIALMNEHGANWVKPWACNGLNCNAKSKRQYRGVNMFLTSLARFEKGFGSAYWNTYKGWQDMGHQIAKGSKGTGIVFWKTLDVTDKETGEDKSVSFARWYTVFNADQLDGKTFFEPAIRPVAGADLVANAERFIRNTGADIRYQGDRACYIPSQDHILIPPADRFNGSDTSSATSAFYATQYHELGHWTGHKSRLDRSLTGYFGSPEYAFEELIAELTSTFLCVSTGIDPTPRPDHAKYLNNWKAGLADHNGAILRAFSQAQKAVDYLDNLQEWERQAA